MTLNISKQSGYLARYYDGLCRQFSRSYKTVGWYSYKTQEARFNIASQIADWNGQSILDIGCGLGDLWGYLKENGIAAHYSGIDISQKMIALSQAHFPEVSFRVQDLFDRHFQEKYDYCFASGPFNHRLNVSQNIYIQEAISRMVEISTKGVVFNVLSDKTPFKKRQDHEFFYYNAQELAVFSQTLVSRVVVKENYLPNDVTLFLYK